MKMTQEINTPWQQIPDNLPGWLDPGLRAALIEPESDTLGAMIAAGRLLRLYTGPSLTELRALRDWVITLSDDVWELAQEHAGFLFQRGIDCLLRFSRNKKVLTDIFEGYSIEIEKEDQIPLDRNWVYKEIENRDDLASLQHVLRIAVDGNRTDARLFFYIEVASMASHWDAIGENFVDELKHVIARRKVPEEFHWLAEFADSDQEPWWLNVAFFAFSTENLRIPDILVEYSFSESIIPLSEPSWIEKIFEGLKEKLKPAPAPFLGLVSDFFAVAGASVPTGTHTLHWRPEKGDWFGFAKWPPDRKTGNLEIFLEKLPKEAIGLFAFGKYYELKLQNDLSACIQVCIEDIQDFLNNKITPHIVLVLDKTSQPIIGFLDFPNKQDD
jgi:hypothetical protein